MKTITALVFAIMLFAGTTAVFADCYDAFDSFKCVPCQMADEGD